MVGYLNTSLGAWVGKKTPSSRSTAPAAMPGATSPLQLPPHNAIIDPSMPQPSGWGPVAGDGQSAKSPLPESTNRKLFANNDNQSAYPLMTPSGLIRATLREIPAWSSTSTTSATSL